MRSRSSAAHQAPIPGAGISIAAAQWLPCFPGDCDKVHFHQGLFPATGDPLKDEKFSFVHSDVDLYERNTKGLRLL
jgi:hypothetical protein